MNPAAPSPSAAVRKAGLLLPVLRRSAESWGNHHCAGELRRAIALIEDLSAPAAAVGGGSQLDHYQAKMREILCKALDADISDDETLWVLVNRAANALYWRGKEIEELRAANVATPAAPVGGFVVDRNNPPPNWCRTCGKHRDAKDAVFCSDSIHLQNSSSAADVKASVSGDVVRERVARQWLESKAGEECKLPPDGWHCTRGAGHVGPCASVPNQDLRSCTICGLTVDISKGHVSPSSDFTMQGRTKPKAPAAQSSVVGAAQTESEFQRMRRVVGDIRRGVEVQCVNDNPAAQPSAKDGVRVEGLHALLVRARAEYRDSDAAGDVLDWLEQQVEATTAAVLVEWRWVDEKGRAMTNWKQSDPPPMREVSDMKGTMRVEIREAAIGREVGKP